MSNNFHGGHWGQCLELLSHLCQHSDDILLISGPQGIGKTTMKTALGRQEQGNFAVCEILATPGTTAQILTDSIDAIYDSSDKDLLLLIDDAQKLSSDSIALLLQLKLHLQKNTTNKGLLHIVLFATPELDNNIEHSVIKDDFVEQVHKITIEPLTLLEVEAFLKHEWREEHDLELSLSKSKYKKIYALSGGIPGRVKEIAREMLLNKSNSKATRNTIGLSPFAVGLTVSFGVLFCILAIIWPAADEPLLSTQPVVITKETEVLNIAENTPTVINDPVVEQAIAESAVVEPPVVAATVVDDVARVSSNVAEYEEKISKLERELRELQQQLSVEKEARRAAEAKLVSSKKIVPARNSTHESHILAMPGQNYALQLFGTNHEKKAQDFIYNNSLTNKAYYYKGVHKGKPWFIVVYGNYINKMEAQKALSKLPTSLRKMRPWPRQYSKIHESITKRSKND